MKQCPAALFNDSRTTCYACTLREGHDGPHDNPRATWRFEPLPPNAEVKSPEAA